MNAKYTIENIAGRMAAMGYATSSIDVSTSGEYLVEDAMWNTMDLRHADKLHPQVEKSTPFFVDHRVCCYAIHMKVLGIAVPIIGITYLVNDATLGAVLNLPFGFLVKSDIECTQDTETRTTVRVRYTILSHRHFKFMHRLIAWSLQRNFNLLMKDDVPMRERKMELRRLGFGSTQNPCSFLNSLDIGLNNIRFDPDRAPHAKGKKDVSISFDDLRTGGGTRIELTPEKSFLAFKDKESVLIFPSYCPHEGAKLDSAQCQDGHLVCPWHGRRLKPLCRFEKSNGVYQPDTAQRLGNFNVTAMNDSHCLHFHELST